MKSLSIHSKIHDYEVTFHDSLSFWDNLLKTENAVFVADRNIVENYPQLFSPISADNLLVLDAKEELKNLDTVSSIYRFLSGRKAKRNLTLISLGGGIIQDLTGFAASTLYRGIGWYFVPTTFLAQADSCVGSKTSLNFEGFKNILGGFYPPHKIFICPEFLSTLPDEDIHSGVGEVIKFLLLEDRKPVEIGEIERLAKDLWQRQRFLDAISSALSVKQAYIAEDEFDNGKRNLFNYGHCFGHALESASNYAVPHGQAVTIGMIFANLAAYERGLISKIFLQRLNNLMKQNINTRLKFTYFDEKQLLAAMKNDKKRVGDGLVLVMPGGDDVSAIKVTDFSESEFTSVLSNCVKFLGLK